MALKSIRIENFKSIGEIEIVDPQPFSVLVGPNAAGKSNIFAALQFMHHLNDTRSAKVISGFGGKEHLCHKNYNTLEFAGNVTTSEGSIGLSISYENSSIGWANIKNNKIQSLGFSGQLEGYQKIIMSDENEVSSEFSQYIKKLSRLFVGKTSIVFQKIDDDSKLAPDASNLEKVLRRILNDEEIKNEFIETLQLFTPGLDRVEVISSEFSSNLDILVYEKALSRPINKELISDGTYNIIAILTALYQSKTPQFLCIEEPENGLNPQVVKELVEICRYLCERYGHYIWLNTHSQSLVSQLKPEEIILVDKVEGFTQTKQFEKGSFGDMPMDEAWLTNTLGGGLPW